MKPTINILLVEDDTAMRVFTRASLMKSSFEFGQILEAANGKEAVEMLKKNDVNLILTDINMPEMGGIEFMDWIHNHPIYKNIPVVAVTTVQSKSLMNMLAFWGHGYMNKPFNLDLLEEQLYKFHGKENEHYYLHG